MKTTFTKTLLPMLLTSAIAGTILTVMAPFGTSGFTVVARWFYWVGFCCAGGLGAGVFGYWLVPKNSGILKSAFIQSIGATLFVWITITALHAYLYGAPNLNTLLLMPFFIWIVSMTICSFGALMQARSQTQAQLQDLKDNAGQQAPDRAAILSRLKPALRAADIYALSAEDHYVRVMTSQGDDLILMRFSDALSEVTPLPGLHVHRSWWVAEAAVKTAKSQDGKIQLILRNDVVAPVSRSAAKTVRAAGWA